MPRESLLRTKLLVWLLLPLSVLLVADTAISYWMALRFSQRAYDRSLTEIAREVSLHLRAGNAGLEFDMPQAAREVLFSDPSDRLYYEIATATGQIVAGDSLAPAPTAAGVTQREVLYDGVAQGAPIRIVQLKVPQDVASARPAAVVRVAETKVKREELAREILLSVVLPQVVLIVLAGILVWFGVVHGLAPLDRLRRAVESRLPRERGPVLVSEVPGEVRPLIHAINGLLERLDGMLTLQSRFVADAAHQLKTPVAALQAQLELALREADSQRMRQSVEKLYSGLERLSRLVSQLLSLARNEPDAVPGVTLTALDLNALAFEAATTWVPEALNKGIDLGFDGTANAVVVRGDAGRLRELFDNLLDNAVRYTHAGGRVTVRVVAHPVPAVTVSDDGPAIPPHERARVFERFHRLLGSSRDGSGLGLAIALEIAHIHGASITLADDTDGVGNTFTVSFPPLDSK